MQRDLSKASIKSGVSEVGCCGNDSVDQNSPDSSINRRKRKSRVWYHGFLSEGGSLIWQKRTYGHEADADFCDHPMKNYSGDLMRVLLEISHEVFMRIQWDFFGDPQEILPDAFPLRSPEIQRGAFKLFFTHFYTNWYVFIPFNLLNLVSLNIRLNK